MIIIPNKGISIISFNDAREKIRKMMSQQDLVSFVRGEDSTLIDHFPNLGLFVYYNKNDLCEALEFSNDSLLFLNDINLFKLNYHECEKLLGGIDDKLDIDDNGFTSFKYGLGAYSPDKEEYENTKLESIIIFKEGYYD